MSELASDITGLVVAVVGAWAIPALGMRALVPTLESSSLKVSNYRERSVFLGLGIVWLFWAIGLSLAWILVGTLGGLGGAPPEWTPVYLVLVACIAGMVDDVFGTHGDKGFRGHLRRLAEGRLTTGGLKLVCIGSAALWAAAIATITSSEASGPSLPVQVVSIVAGTLLIAGSSNLVNLLDLRPGRALKGYAVLVALAWAIGVAGVLSGSAAGFSAISALGALVWLVGPVLAVWRYDLWERGMLGDAGANAAGALAGYALMMSLPLWGVVAAAIVILALNVASERYSFSRVIERNRALAWIDGLGRRPEEAQPSTRS